jgi:hypothetical protein
MHFRTPLFGVALCLSFARPAVAQVTCILPGNSPPPACTLKVPTTPSSQLVVVRVGEVAGQEVTFRPLGNGRITGSATTDASGFATTVWKGSPPDSVVAYAIVGKDHQQRVIRFVAEGLRTGRQFSTAPDPVFWYEDRQIPQPVEVRFTSAERDCDSSTVVFRPVGTGTVSVDSVSATKEGSDCIARTWWRLGKGLGYQHLHAYLADEPTKRTILTARARALPRIGVGLALTSDRGFRALVTQAETIQITRKLPRPGGGDSTIVTDSIHEFTTVRNEPADLHMAPILTLDLPLKRDVPGLRVSLGVSLKSPDRDWYAGVNLLQPFIGPAAENLGVDLHAVTHWGRRRILPGPGSCPRTNPCRVEDRFRFLGAGLLVTFDGTPLLSTLTSIFK